MHLRSYSLLLVLCLAVAGCGGDDDCYRERRCQSIGGALTCVWVRVCPNAPDQVLSNSAAASTAPIRENERWDVRVGVSESSEDGLSPLVKRLLGEDVVRRSGAHGYRQWWFHDWSPDVIRAAAAENAGADVHRIRRTPDPRDACPSCCDAPAQVDAGRLPPLPQRVVRGEPLPLHAPAGLVPASELLGLAAYRVPPDDGPVESDLLAAGESTSMTLDRAGRWTIRVVLLAESLCDFGVADAIVVQEAEVEVVERP